MRSAHCVINKDRKHQLQILEGSHSLVDREQWLASHNGFAAELTVNLTLKHSACRAKRPWDQSSCEATHCWRAHPSSSELPAGLCLHSRYPGRRKAKRGTLCRMWPCSSTHLQSWLFTFHSRCTPMTPVQLIYLKTRTWSISSFS